MQPTSQIYSIYFSLLQHIASVMQIADYIYVHTLHKYAQVT